MNISDNDYQSISDIIINELKENDSDIYNILAHTKGYHDEKVIKTIRWMIDNDIVKKNKGGTLSLKIKG